ncbi:DegV family EDD domain-containing protein [Candidatus Parcubacteria bacterium]|nr:DegV family EDD domain-containing protein [Candidatus Parcubacteria bacterium]
MKKIALLTEDVCSLPPFLVKKLEIEIVKTKLFFPEWEKFPEKNLYQLMKETKATPKTSAPSPGDYLSAYKKLAKDFEKILVITLSSKLSACFNCAFQAKELFEEPEKIFIFDSKQAVCGQGLLVLKAKEMIDQGKEIEEILPVLENLKRKIKLFGFLKTTYWAEKIGRVKRWQTIVFEILKYLGVYPYLGISNGVVKMTGFNLWTRDEFKALFNQLKYQAKKGEIVVGINYTDNAEFALNLKEKLEKELKAKVLFCSSVPPIVGANSGPGTILAACYNV